MIVLQCPPIPYKRVGLQIPPTGRDGCTAKYTVPFCLHNIHSHAINRQEEVQYMRGQMIYYVTFRCFVTRCNRHDGHGLHVHNMSPRVRAIFGADLIKRQTTSLIVGTMYASNSMKIYLERAAQSMNVACTRQDPSRVRGLR